MIALVALQHTFHLFQCISKCLRKLMNYKPENRQKLTLTISQIFPDFEKFLLFPNHGNPVQAVQNFACKIVSRAQRYDHVTHIRRQLKWFPVKQHLYYCDSIMAFKCMNCLVLEYLSHQNFKCSSISNRPARNSQLLTILLFRSSTSQRTF